MTIQVTIDPATIKDMRHAKREIAGKLKAEGVPVANNLTVKDGYLVRDDRAVPGKIVFTYEGVA